MEHERILSEGMLAEGASYRLIVSGPIGLREIDQVISKLQTYKEILADDEGVAQ